MAEELNIESNEILDNTTNVAPEIDNASLPETPVVQTPNIDVPGMNNPVETKFPENFADNLGTNNVNFDQGYNDLSMVDGMTFNDSINIALENMPNMERNQPYFDMIDTAAVDMDKYPAVFLNNNMNSMFPGRAGTNFNPWETDTGNIDLSTANGRSAFLAASHQSNAKYKNLIPQTPIGFEPPQEYSARRYNLDRYFRHPNFAELGFHPFANNEAYYQNNSSKWDNFTRTRGAFVDMFDEAFYSGYRSIADMFSGDIAQSDMLGAMAMEDAMRRGSSTSGGARGFFNDLFLNSSYTMGILSNILVEEAVIAGATYLSGGSLAAPGAARTALNVGKGAKATKRLFDLGEWSSAGARMLEKLKNLPELKSFGQAVKNGGRALGTGMFRLFGGETLYQLNKIKQATAAGDNMTQMAKLARTTGGLYRDFRMANLAWSESKMEGGMVEMQLRDDLYETMYKYNENNAPTTKQLEMIAADARQGAFVAQMINLPIIYLSNKIVLGTALRGFRPIGRIMDDALDGPFGRIFRNKKAAKDQFYDIGKEWVVGETLRRMWKAGFKGSMKHAAAVGLRYSAMNFAEGVQELAQEGTAAGVKAYYEGLYELDMAQELDMQLAEMTDNYDAAKKTWYGKQTLSRDPAIDIMDAISRGASSQMSEEGMKVFLSGFLMGGMVQVPQKFMFNTVPNIFRWSRSKIMKNNDWSDFVKQKEETVTNAVNTLNKIGNKLENHFDISKLNALTQKQLNMDMYIAAGAKDIASQFDARDHAIFSHLYTAASLGKIGVFKDMLQGFKSVDDKTLKDAFSENPSTADKIRGRLDNMIERADQVQNNFNKLKDEYINPYDYRRYKKGTRKFQEEYIKWAAFNHAKMMMMFTKDTFEQSLVRANSIMETLASDPVLKTISSQDINILTNPTSLIKEIGLLREELEQEALTKNEKKLKKEKEEKLAILEDFNAILTAEENLAYSNGLMFSDIIAYKEDGTPIKTKPQNVGVFDKRKINKLRPAFVKYLKFLANKNQDFVIEEKLDDTLKKIIDHSYLKGRAMDNYKAMNILMNPEYLDSYVERIAKIMEQTYKNYQKKNAELIKKYVDKKIRVAWLEALAVDGFQPNPNDTLAFLEKGIIPTEYYDQEGLVTRENDITGYNKIQGHIEDILKTQSAKRGETEDAPIQETEAEVAAEETGTPDITTPKGQKIYQDFLNKDENTTEIINKKHDQYKASWNASKGPFMSRDRWALSDKGGLNIIKARYALTEFYENLEGIDRDQYPNMDSWLVDNQRNILVIGSNGILPSYGLKLSDVALDIAVKEGIPADKIEKNERITEHQDKQLGINILETTVYDNDNQPSKFYEIVDNNKENVYDQYKDMDDTGLWMGKSFSGDKQGLLDAVKVWKDLQKKLAGKMETIPFAGEQFKKGDIIQDTNNETWMIDTTYANVKRHGNIMIVPTKKAHLKGKKRGVKFLTEKQYAIQNWKPVKEKPTINVKNALTTKITRYQPLIIYPFDGSKVDKGYDLYGKFPGYKNKDQAQQELERNLRDLSQEEIEGLTLLIETNPSYDQFKKDLDAENITPETNPFNQFDNFDPNPNLATGVNQYEITIMNGSQPIGKLKGLTSTILFDGAKQIDGTKITPEQASELFVIGRTEDPEQVAGSIRRNYAKAALIMEDISNALSGAKTGQIKLTDLVDIEFTSSTGLNGWRIDSKTGEPKKRGGVNASTAYGDLKYKTFDGEIIIYDTRRNFRTGRRSSRLVTARDPNDPNIRKIEDQIINQLEKDFGRGTSVKDLNMGRYVQFVKLPSGAISYFELKTDPLSAESVNNTITDIKNIQQEILDVNKKDGKFKPKSEKFNPDAIVQEKNDEISDKFYINTNQVGTNLELFFDKRGQLVIKVEKIGKEDLYAFVDVEDMGSITNSKQFVEKINDALVTYSSLKDVQWSADEVKGILKSDSFQPKLPMTIKSADDLISVGVSARIIPTLKFGMIASMNFTNDDRIQDKLSGIDTTKTASKQNVTNEDPIVEAEDLTTEVFEDLINGEMETIPASIIEGIRNKIIAGEKIYPNEQLVIDMYKEREGIDLMMEGDSTSKDAATQKNDDGLQAEADNQNVLKLISAKKNEIKKKKQALENKLRKELMKKNPGMSTGALNIQVDELVDNDDVIKKLEKELNTLRGQRGFKIVDGFDSRDVEHIKTFVEWAQQNLPDFIQIKDIEDLGRRLSKNNVTLGVFLNELAKTSAGIKDLTGTIYVGKQTGFRYHEAFHAVFRMMLSEAEIKQYLSLAKTDVLSKMKSGKGYEIVPGVFVKSMAEARDQLTRLSKMYALMDESTLNDRVFEEYLADEFEKFKTNPRSTSIASTIKSFFNKIIAMIKHVFLQYKKNEIQDLFNSIDGGQFRGASIQDNRFTNSSYTDSSILEQSGAVTMVAPKIRKGDPIKVYKPTIEENGTVNPEGRIIYVNNYLSSDRTASIVTEISALYINKLHNLSRQKDFTGQYNPKTILNEVIDAYVEERNPARSQTLESGEVKYFYADRENWSEIKDDLKELYSALTKYKKDVISDVNNYLNLFDLQIEDQEIELDRNSFSLVDSLKSDEDFESSANEIGGVKSLSKGIRLFLATRTKQVKDEFTGEMVSTPVDYMNSYRALMKSLSGISDPYQMIVKLKMFSDTSADAKAVIDSLLTRFNLSSYSLDQLIAGEYDINKITDSAFFNAIIKGFQQLRSDYIQIEHDPSKGVVNFYKANNKDDASTQEDSWQESYSLLVKGLNKNPKQRSAAQTAWQSINFYSDKKNISDQELDSVSRQISTKIRDTSGINLNWMTIKFLILNGGVVNKEKSQTDFVKMFKPESSTIFETEDINEVIIAIGEHGMTSDNKMTGNLFFDMNEQTNPADNDHASTGTDVKFRIRKLAQLNAIFDPTVGATVFRNAEGKLIYAHQMPTYNLEKIAEMDRKDVLDEMIEDPFLQSDWLLNNPKFRSLVASGKFRISRVAGTRTTNLDVTDENGYKANNKLSGRSGIDFGKSSGQTFIATLINLYISDFNSATGDIDTKYYIDPEDNKSKPYATSLVDITVISESKTADWVPLPIVAAVELKNGKAEITDEYVDTIETSLINNEYQRISRESNEKEGFTEDTYVGYNDSKDGRAYKLYSGSKLLSKSRIKVNVLKKLNERGFGISADELNNINELQENDKYTFFRTSNLIAKLNLNVGQPVITPIYTIKKGGKGKLSTQQYVISYNGIQSSDNFTLDQLMVMLKGDIKKGKASDTLKKRVTIGDEVYHVRTVNQKDFLDGKSDLHMMDIRPLTKVEQEVSAQTGEDVAVEQVSTAERKTYSGKVTSLQSNQVFVFGSNPEGRHGAGAAKLARTKFGAIYGQGEGLQGQSYALPTKDLRVKENKGLRSISSADITNNIKKLYETARKNSSKEFLVSDYSGKNLNGYTGQELADMFANAGPIPNNIVFHDNFQKLFPTDVAIKDNISVAEGGDVGTSVIKKLELAANAGESYESAKARIEKEEGITLRELIKQRLEEEYQLFRQILKNTEALDLVDKRITEGLKTAKGNATSKAVNNSMNLLNLKRGNSDYNLKQIFLNDYLNRMSVKKLLLKDPALLFKDAVDEIKRAKALNAAGPNASSLVSSPYRYKSDGSIRSGHGVDHPVKNISLVTIEDVETLSKYGRQNTDEKKVTESDAQLWYTVKAFRYMMFGLGSLTEAQAHILDRIEKGENISINDFYGAGVTTQGYKSLGGIINSKKFVYFDGETFLKMSAFVLTKRLTSDPATNFQEALPGRDDIHNLRSKLENIEETRPETIAIAAPVSASKAAKKNIISVERAFNKSLELSDSEITNLDARWMRLQQITPSNKGVATDPTQIKSLITSEHDDSVEVTIGGKKMTLGEVRALYNKTTGDRVEIKFLNRRNLIFDFQTMQDQLQESIELGSLTVDLQSFLRYSQRALQASGASPQLLELFETDKTGAQKYDLNNPITVGKFQQLFMAFLSKGVLNEKITGESVALVSGVGMKVVKKVLELDENNQPKRWEVIKMDDWVKDRQEISSAGKNWADPNKKIFTGLKVNDFYVDELRANVQEYDENGNETGLVYSEYMLPAHFASLKNLKRGEAIPDAVAKAFGVRIPSQDKHSAINLRLVDFLPVEYGSSGVFPSDIIEISGADFDIDKLYIHFKEFYYDKDKGFVEYGKAKKVEEQYDEYLRYVIEQVEKSGTSYFMAAEKWSNSGSEIDPILDKDVSLPSEEVIGALTQLSMPITLDEFKAYKKKFNRLPHESAASNLALDLKYAMLGNKGMTEARDGRNKDHGPAYEPAVLDPVEEAWKYIQDVLPEVAEMSNEDNLILDNIVGMYRSWVNNKAGANAIGASVLPNIALNLLKEYGISLRRKNSKGVKILGGNIRLNEIDFTSFKGDYTINPLTKKPNIQGDRKQFILSALITAATDNAKHRYLAKLGLKTKDALAKVVLMTGLGVDLKTSMALINQPDISKMYDQIVADPSLSIKGLLGFRLGDLEIKNPNVKTNYEGIEVTRKLLEDNVNTPEEIDDTERYAILKQFEQLTELGERLFQLQSLSSNTAFDYKGTAELNQVADNFTELGVELDNKAFNLSMIPIDTRKLFDKNTTYQGRYYSIYKNITQSLPAVFLSETPTFKKLQKTILKNFNKFARTARNRDQVEKDITSYLVGKAYTHLLNKTGRGRLTASLRNGFIYDEFADNGITINSTIDTIKEYLKGTEDRAPIENEFIDNFLYKKETSNPVGKSGINEAVSKYYTNLSARKIVELQNSIRDLYAIDDIKEEVVHLIHYLLLKDGLQYNNSGRTFLSLVPAALMEEMLVASGTVTDLFNNQNISKSQFESIFGSNFQEMSFEFLEGYMSARRNQYYLPLINKRIKNAVQIRKYQKGLKGNYIKRNTNPIEVLIDKEGSVTMTIEPFGLDNKKTKRKGKFSQQQPNLLSKEGTINQNVNKIQNSGLEVDFVEMVTRKGTQRLKVLQFPMVVTVNVGSDKKPNFKTLRLKEVYTSKKMDDSSMVYDYDNDMFIAHGWKAVYEDFETLGSMQQNPVAFIYGPRSTYNYLQDRITERDAAIKKAEEKKESVEDKKDVKQKTVGTGFTTTATNDGVEYTYNQEKSVPLESTAEKNLQDSKEETPGGMMSLAEFKKQAATADETQEGEYSKLSSAYENLTKAQKTSIARPVSEGGLDISTAEELIEEFKIANEDNGITEDDMIERIKKCYSK